MKVKELNINDRDVFFLQNKTLDKNFDKLHNYDRGLLYNVTRQISLFKYFSEDDFKNVPK